MSIANKKYSKKIFYFLGLLIMGALGSGLWDLFFKDLIFYLGGIFVNMMSKLHSGYVDGLYEKVGSGTSYLEILCSLLIIIIIIFLPLFITVLFNIITRKFYSKTIKDEKTSASDKVLLYITKTKRRIIAIILILTIPLSVMYTNLLIKGTMNFKAQNSIERAIEIVRPYTSDSEFWYLRSEFRLIDNKEKLETLFFRVDSIAELNKLELPDRNLYQIGENNDL